MRSQLKTLLFLRRCFDLARLGSGSTSPNPSVGAVIVADSNIIGEGFHQKYGDVHAEVNAVKMVDVPQKLQKAKIFVSLEPCYHFGKTPPCVNLILEKKIPAVCVATLDPNPLVAGKSIEKLIGHGIETTVLDEVVLSKSSESKEGIDDKIKDKLLSQGFHATLMPFFTNLSHKRPYIILKWAESADGYLGKIGERTPLSNPYVQRLVHKWRGLSDGIMVGTSTAAIDNPALDNRFFYGKSPVRIVFDKNNRLSRTLNIFDGSTPTFVFLTSTDSENIHEESHKNVKIIAHSFDENHLTVALERLYAEKIRILFVEGGAQLLNSFIEAGLWDEARVIKTPVLLGDGIIAPKLAQAQYLGKNTLDDNSILFYKKM